MNDHIIDHTRDRQRRRRRRGGSASEVIVMREDQDQQHKKSEIQSCVKTQEGNDKQAYCVYHTSSPTTGAGTYWDIILVNYYNRVHSSGVI